MHPIIWSIGPLRIPTFGVLVACGVFFGFLLFEKESKRLGLPPQKTGDIAFWAALGGFLSSRLVYVLFSLREYRSLIEVFKIWEGGLVLYGGLLPAVGLALLLIRFWRLSLYKVLDASVLGLCFGFGMGRLGCFSAGCCYGRMTDLPWGVVFSDPNSLAPQGVKLHPTQLYESLFFWACFAFFTRRRPQGNGLSFWGLMLSYSLFRFFNEFLRGDPRAFFLGLSHNQWVMIGLFILSLSMLIYLRNVKNNQISASYFEEESRARKGDR